MTFHLDPTRRLYFAYGSNLNREHMRYRCPTATPVGPLFLPHASLRFRGVADVVYRRDSDQTCPGALWEITREDERALDRYEGVSHNLYQRHHFTVLIDGQRHRVLVYQMTDVGIMPPTVAYYETIVQGYRDFNLPLPALERALAHSHAHRRKTPRLRRRYARLGSPTLQRTVP